MARLLWTEKPEQLFHELVSEAIEAQSTRPSDGSATYLVQLLGDFVCPRQLHERTETLPDRPVAEIFCTAVASDGMRRLTLLKLAGDLALFTSGLLPDSLGRAAVGFDYYHRIGGTAYTTAAVDCRSRAVAQLFRELAEQFVLLVDVLNEVSERCALSERPDLLGFHRRWIETGSQRSAEALRRGGVAVEAGSTTVN